MTQEDLIQYFVNEVGYTKSDLRSLKQIYQAAETHGLEVTKVSEDEYRLTEKNAIKDFKKPIRKLDNLPAQNEFEWFRGCPVKLLLEWFMKYQFPIVLWTYLANLENGATLDFEYLSQQLNRPIENLVAGFDMLSEYGFLTETDEYIDFTYAPINDGRADYAHYHKSKRLTPLEL